MWLLKFSMVIWYCVDKNVESLFTKTKIYNFEVYWNDYKKKILDFCYYTGLY